MVCPSRTTRLKPIANEKKWGENDSENTAKQFDTTKSALDRILEPQYACPMIEDRLKKR